MLSNSKIAAVLPITNVEQSKSFYTDVLGLRLVKEDQENGTLMYQSEGSTLFLYKRPPVTTEHTQVGFSVDDVEREVEELRDKGVKFEEYDMPGLKTNNGVAVMGDTKSAWFKDPDGNILSLNQMG